MSDSEYDVDFSYDDDGSIGLGEEDKNKVNTNQQEWYKGEKGRTDRIALVYFNTLDVTNLRRAIRQKPDLTLEQKKAIVVKVRQQLAEKLSKSVDQLDSVDMLDLSEARFKPFRASFKQNLGYFAWPKNLTHEEEKIWRKTGEPKDYVCTVILWYPTDREGEVEKDRLVKGSRILPWRFSPDKWDVIRKINRGLLESGSSISKIDLNVSCTDTGFQKITITQAGPAMYQRNDALKRLVLEKAVALYPKLNPFREITTDELREKLGMPPVAGAAGSDYSSEGDITGVLANV